MLKLSTFPFKTLKTRPKVSDNISTSILLQAGFIRQTMAGVYSYTTLGLKVLENIKKIIREELDIFGCHEVYMPGLSPKAFWDKTGRWDIEDYFKVEGHEKKQYRLNPTHEEVVVPLMQEFLSSYKDSGTCVYQIKDKYRNEKRAKSGLLRGRDFIMKDAYSFHSNEKDFEKLYEKMKLVYMNIFNKLGLGKDTYITLADGGVFTEKYSHEFQVVLPIGEDDIYICGECNAAHNKEVIGIQEGFVCSGCKSKNHIIKQASEAGNIFPLETKYTKAFGMKFTTENNSQGDVIMGCYGIGISRIMGILAEYFMSEKGIDWPESVAPASHYIIVLGEDNIEKATQLAKQIEQDGGTVILDDRMGRKVGFGQKAGDCELFGIPNRIVISSKTLEKGGYELMTKKDSEGKIVKL